MSDHPLPLAYRQTWELPRRKVAQPPRPFVVAFQFAAFFAGLGFVCALIWWWLS